jgi:PAS domain S-box-containing protein
LGSVREGLVQWRPGQGTLARWTTADGLPGDAAWGLALDPRSPGGMWVGGDEGLAWLEQGRLAATGPDGIAYAGPVRIVYVDPKPPHALWLAALEGGPVEVRPEGARVHGAADGMALDRVRFFHRDRAGRLLAGGRQGLFALEDGRWSKLALDGLSPRELTAIVESDSGELWLASSIDGLVSWSGTSAKVLLDGEGMPFLPIHSMSLDRHDGLWLSGNDGLARISRDEYARWRRGQRDALPIEWLGQRDGLRDAECNGWGWPSLAYPTLTGMALVDTVRRTPSELTPAEIYVDHAWAGPRALPLEGVIDLDATERSLRVDFSAIEMQRPEAVAFRYMLEGHDSDWTLVGRATESNYARLMPGRFRFRLQARLPGMDWVESSAGLRINARPAFRETQAFSVGLLLLAIAAVVALFLWRRHIDGRHAQVLWQAKTFLRDVIDTSPHPIFARRRDGTYSLANRAAADVYGLEPEQLEGRSPESMGVELAGMPKLDALDGEVIRTGSERTVAEGEVVDHEGRHRWFRVAKRPWFGPDGGEVEQVIGTAVDITDYKLAAMDLRSKEASLVASSTEARLLSRKLLRAQEDERRRLARELHDDLTQRLAGLAMLAWSTLQALERDPGRDVVGNLREVAMELEQLANEVQTLARDLHPPALDTMGLAEALRLECATFAQRTGMEVAVDCGDLPADLSPEVALAIHRMVQEGLRNARTHSGVQEVRVRLERVPEGLALEISDAGVGFDPQTPRSRRGMGLSSLAERARLAGGRLQVQSAPGLGTQLVVRIPWPSPGSTD